MHEVVDGEDWAAAIAEGDILLQLDIVEGLELGEIGAEEQVYRVE